VAAAPPVAKIGQLLGSLFRRLLPDEEQNN
jgi:hypothetical protein